MNGYLPPCAKSANVIYYMMMSNWPVGWIVGPSGCLVLVGSLPSATSLGELPCATGC